MRLAIEPDHSVTYGLHEGRVDRDELRAGKAVRHESFPLPRGSLARFEQRTEAKNRLVALVMTGFAGKSKSERPLPLEIVAAPGKGRFVKRGAGS